MRRETGKATSGVYNRMHKPNSTLGALIVLSRSVMLVADFQKTHPRRSSSTRGALMSI
jgi:hypothetical protein